VAIELRALKGGDGGTYVKTLGQLKRLSPKEVWKHEAAEFTPWLRENISLLADTLGMEVDLVEREVPVGDFAADLVAKDLNSDRWVVIENQLDPTDHRHLGQVLTYAANRKAGVIVWISPEFRDEHRQALEWLNDVTGEDIDFFGLQLELLQIDDSSAAPNFSVVARPSAWQKESRRRGQITPRQQAYHEFFSALLKELKARAPGITSAQSVGYDNWFAFSTGRPGFSYSFSFALNKRFRVELYIDQGDQELNKAAFDLLHSQKDTISAEVGLPVEWERLDTKRACRIAVYTRENIRVTDPPDALAELRKWAVDTGVRFRGAMGPRIQGLKLESG
jgi:hypothetical protein